MSTRSARRASAPRTAVSVTKTSPEASTVPSPSSRISRSSGSYPSARMASAFMSWLSTTPGRWRPSSPSCRAPAVPTLTTQVRAGSISASARVVATAAAVLPRPVITTGRCRGTWAASATVAATTRVTSEATAPNLRRAPGRLLRRRRRLIGLQCLFRDRGLADANPLTEPALVGRDRLPEDAAGEEDEREAVQVGEVGEGNADGAVALGALVQCAREEQPRGRSHEEHRHSEQQRTTQQVARPDSTGEQHPRNEQCDCEVATDADDHVPQVGRLESVCDLKQPTDGHQRDGQREHYRDPTPCEDEAAPGPGQPPDRREGTSQRSRQAGCRGDHDEQANQAESRARAMQGVVEDLLRPRRHLDHVVELPGTTRGQGCDGDEDREDRGEELSRDRHRTVEELHADRARGHALEDPPGPPRQPPFDPPT